MKIYISFLMLLFGLNFTIGQQFKDGFIIQSGDSIKGKVKFRSNTKNYSECLFINTNNQSETFSPRQIDGFGYSNERYFLSGVVDDEFLEIVISGEITMYSGSKGFYLQKGDELVYLDHPKESKIPTKWKGLLSYMTGSCLSEQEVNELKYKERDISEAIISYHKCQELSYNEPKGHLPWVKLYKGLLVGYSSSSIESTNVAVGFPLLVSDSYSSRDIVLGMSFEWISHRSINKLSFYSEFLINTSEYSGTVLIPSVTGREFGDPDFRGNLYTSNFNLNQLSIPVGAKYSFNSGNSNLFFIGGLHFNINFSNRIDLTSQEVNGSIISEDQQLEFLDLRSATYGLWGAGGYSKNFDAFKGTLMLRYFPIRRLNQEAGFELAQKRFSIAIILSK